MRKIPFLRICLALIGGIFFNSYFPGFYLWKIILLGLSVSMMGASYFLSIKSTQFILPFGFLLLLSFFMMGVVSDEMQELSHQKNHFSHFVADEESIFEGVVIGLKKGEESKKNSLVVSVKRITSKQVSISELSGKLQIYTDNKTLVVNDEIIFSGKIHTFQEPTNKYTFDYKTFQSRKGIYFQCFPNIVEKSNHYSSIVMDFRTSFMELINSLDVSETTRSILKAMLLGNKDGLHEMMNIFRATGTSHVLAISGLHVGIITALLLGMISFIPKRKRILRNSVVLIGVWGFCVISGMSPSTVRATIMVSGFLVSNAFRLKGFGFNFCFMAGFFMLVVNPKAIYDIGFQFSFLAILGILYFYEPLYKTLLLRGIADRLWQMTVLSISAQVALTPLSLYYFHEFPLLFLPASMFAIPATFLIVSGGLITCLVQWVLPSLTILSNLIDWFVHLYVDFLAILANIDGVVVENLAPSLLEVGLYYVALFSISIFFTSKSKKTISIFVGAYLLLILSQFYFNHKLTKPKLVIYGDKKHIVIDVIQNGSLAGFYETEDGLQKMDWSRKPMKIASHVYSEKMISLSQNDNHIIKIKDKRILIVNDPDQKKIENGFDYVLLNCKLNRLNKYNGSALLIDFDRNYDLRNKDPAIKYNSQVIHFFD